jgi:pyruvate formate lyase activating enzyme
MAYTLSGSNYLECSLCPHNCRIKEKKSGICGVRFNNNKNLTLPFNGLYSALSIDPIEKKPLYNFYPGSDILSIGFYGCNFHCQFCQNFRISQKFHDGIDTKYIGPEELVAMAEKSGLKSIAYTYSEPLIHFEYVKEAALRAHTRGIKNVLVTNGFMNTLPAKELLQVMDGVNIDLKTFNNQFYCELGGSLQPVKEFINLSQKLTHTEITTLIIPGKNDSRNEIRDIAKYLSDLNPNIPLHLSCYFPSYNYDIAPTPIEVILDLAEIVGEHLNYVYPGNIGKKEVKTFCKKCKNILISRTGYSVSTKGIENGKCTNCSTKIPFPC